MALLVGCGGGGSTPATVQTTPVATAKAVISGRVLDTQDGTPVVGATISAGTASTTSGADGAYVLNNVEAGSRVVLVAGASNYSETVKVTAAQVGATTTFDIKLLKVAATAAIGQTSGGVVTVPGSVAQVSLPANFAVLANGSAPVGNVTVKVTPIAPATDSSLMPGDYTTATAGGSTSIESFGAMAVSLSDASGAKLNLAPAKTATIRIPVSTRSSAATLSPTIPLFYVSEQTGRWVEEGTATLMGTAPNQYYEGVVSHFSVWNADQVYDSVVVSGCVNDEKGLQAAGVTVQSDGISYSGVSSATTDALGQFTLRIKKSGTATVGGFLSNKITNEVAAGPNASDFVLTPCLQLTTLANSIKIKLTWGELPDDLDSYLTLPTGEVVSYHERGSLLAAPFVNLDVDDTSSYGPEIITVRKLLVGTYSYAVRNYSGSHAPGVTGSPAKVELNASGNTSLYAPPVGEATTGQTVWNVFNFVVAPNCSVTVTPVNTWSSSEPKGVASPTAAAYCVAP